MAEINDVSNGCILMLHGYKQSDTIFYKKTSGLRKHLTKHCNYELFYPCGQLKIEAHQAGDHTGVEDQPDTVDMYSWLYRDNVTGISKISNDLSVAPLFKYVEENITAKGKKLVGIIGFSQGACFTSVLIEYYSHLDILENLKFGIMFSGFHLPEESILKESVNKVIETKNREESLKSLHVMGTLDTVVEDSKTLGLFEHYEKKHGSENTELLKHLGGHYVPNNKAFLLKVATWIENSSATNSEVKTENKDAKRDENNKEIPDLDDELLKSINSLGF